MYLNKNHIFIKIYNIFAYLFVVFLINTETLKIILHTLKSVYKNLFVLKNSYFLELSTADAVI